ncbi:MAG: hypothetical protein OXR62_13275 [Ahrensia sp.]|nr:hypothetical protein [Ahrensia sp.]
MKKLMLAAIFLSGFATAQAGEADVTNARATNTGGDLWNFSVTVQHADEGWDHYADKWEVVAPDGTVLATRVLAHPHVDEQPFTRSKSGILIPPGIAEVTVRAGDNVHGIGGREITIKLEK